MKAVNPPASNKRGGAEWATDMGNHTGRSVRPSKGASPSASMIDGPFGGSKPA